MLERFELHGVAVEEMIAEPVTLGVCGDSRYRLPFVSATFRRAQRMGDPGRVGGQGERMGHPEALAPPRGLQALVPKAEKSRNASKEDPAP